MLKMRPVCERCDRNLPADAAGAFICSFECTWCEACATGPLGGVCPNCQGALQPRPTRVGAALERHPASTGRMVSG